MRPKQLRAILIFPITPTTIFAGYSYTTGTQKAAKIWSKNSSFNWVHSLHTELVNASHSTNLSTNSYDHISTNGKAPLHSHINLQNPTISLLSQICEPIRRLAHKDVPWFWTKEQDVAFDRI